MHIPREVFESDDLKDAMDAFLNEFSHRFNLDHYCRNGGSIGDVEIGDIEIYPHEKDDLCIKGKFPVEFYESYYNGCKDLEWRVDFKGHGHFSINQDSEEIDISISAMSVPEREMEEPEGLDSLAEEFINEQKEKEKDA
jgi:hypothetical protein